MRTTVFLHLYPDVCYNDCNIYTRGKNLLSTNQSNIIFQSLMNLHRKHKELLFIKCGFLAPSEVRNKRSI